VPRFLVNHKADQDLLSIALYGIENYGIKSSRAYRKRLVQKFEYISEHPELYPKVNHIRPGYGRCVFGSHSIYFRIHGNSIEIMRVLGRQDIAVLKSSN
jgi:toxin ParE1/3/4